MCLDCPQNIIRKYINKNFKNQQQKNVVKQGNGLAVSSKTIELQQRSHLPQSIEPFNFTFTTSLPLSTFNLSCDIYISTKLPLCEKLRDV